MSYQILKRFCLPSWRYLKREPSRDYPNDRCWSLWIEKIQIMLIWESDFVAIGWKER